MALKIGIITLSASYNCGSMLQSYALKTILAKYGEVEIINFTSDSSRKQYSIIPKNPLKLTYLKFTNSRILEALRAEKADYTAFQRNCLMMQDKEYDINNLHEIKDKYDVVVAGSDQVWNVCMSDFDESFFCGWCGKHCKKVAYAPSLGGHDIRESPQKEKFIEYILDFDFLSTREEFGKKVLSDITARDIPKVLDPTLMLQYADWENLVGSPLVHGDYIFYYSWAYCYGELREVVAARSQTTGLPVYVIDAHKYRGNKLEGYDFILSRQGGPLAFLNLMRYAKEVYVESFHGMIFAYTFKKNFWLLDTHANYEQLDSRLREIVDLFKVRDRLIQVRSGTKPNLDAVMEYADNETLRELKQQSFSYLNKAFV